MRFVIKLICKNYSPVWVVLGAIIYGIVKEYLTTKRKQP